MIKQASTLKTDTPPIAYENVTMKNLNLPINVFLRSSDSRSSGCEFHWHEELEFYYVISGGVSLLCNGRQEWLYPGDIEFVNWCEPHRGNGFLDHTEHYIIQIGMKFLEDETISIHNAATQKIEKYNLLSLLIAQNPSFPKTFKNVPELRHLLDRIIQEEQNKEIGYELKIKAAILEIFTFLVRSANFTALQNADSSGDSASMEHLKKILIYLSGHYTNPEDVSLAALGRRFGLSIPYLCRIFKKHTNLTLNAYVNELRCSRAASYIQEGVTLEQAAVLTGFHDYNYFSRVFKKNMGCSPSKYQKNV